MQREIKDYQAMKDAIRELCEFFALLGVPQSEIFDSKLVMNELIGNVLKHSSGVANVEGAVKDGFVELKVRSSVQFFPPEESRLADVYSESGRGLYLVDRVSTERSVDEDGTIKILIKIGR